MRLDFVVTRMYTSEMIGKIWNTLLHTDVYDRFVIWLHISWRSPVTSRIYG